MKTLPHRAAGGQKHNAEKPQIMMKIKDISCVHISINTDCVVMHHQLS